MRIFTGRSPDTLLPAIKGIGIQGHNKASTKIESHDSDGQVHTQLDKPVKLDTNGKQLDTLVSELKHANARVGELQSASAEQQHIIVNNNQTLTSLKDELQNEKKTNERLQFELSKKNFSIADLEERVYKLRDIIIRYETAMDQNKIDIKKLKNQLANLKLKINEQQNLPDVNDNKEASEKANEMIETQYDPPNPNDIIDWVIKKRSE
ncbi:hypothetical protein DSCA_56860 [Desulfosarcina alkanivorans]|uniref:Uncharacterized protein n=1 Tax=Desulfosarcina alkanivorans TaxID=571177 RepID=A0A5K7YR87_9BACT|nr:hypothetical protein DSCA_56860 [Desulfosarcina alkanivorans]